MSFICSTEEKASSFGVKDVAVKYCIYTWNQIEVCYQIPYRIER